MPEAKNDRSVQDNEGMDQNNGNNGNTLNNENTRNTGSSDSSRLSVSHKATPVLRRFKKADVIKFIVLLAVLAIFIALIIAFFPFFLSLREESVRNGWIDWLKSLGFKGLLVSTGIQAIQVVLAVIPGEPVEIGMGFLYGTWGGLGICLLGIFIGSLIIFLLVKLLGVSFVKSLVGEEKMKKMKFLHNEKSLDTVVFILFLIPGTPKDMLTYFIPLTPMKPVRFLILATFARIPSVITSTLVGASLGSNRWGLSILIFILTAIMGIIGIQINNWYMKKHEEA